MMDSLALTVAAGMVSLPCMTGNPSSAPPNPSSHQWRRVAATGTSSPVSTSWINHVGIEVEELAVLPGSALTEGLLQRISERRVLLGAIDQMKTHPFTRSARDGQKATSAAAAAARAFVQLLPGNVAVPRVAPDGEGGLMFVWGRGLGGAIVIVDGLNLHAVANPTTPQARYLDDIPFNVVGTELPREIVDVLPTA